MKRELKAWHQDTFAFRVNRITARIGNDKRVLYNDTQTLMVGLEKSGVPVSGLFFSSSSLRSLFLASILKVIATASNLLASVGSRSVELVYFCFLMAPQLRYLRVVTYIYRPISLQ